VTDSDCLLEFRLLMTLQVELDVPRRLGKGPYGYRSVFAAKAGAFEFSAASDFAGFSGTLAPGPADYCLRAPPDASRWLTCSVRGALNVVQPQKFTIYMHYEDCVPFSDADADKLTAGGTIDFRASHFIVRPHFEVGDTDTDGVVLAKDFARRIAALNGMPLVAHARLRPLGIDYQVYEILNPYSPPPT
jgi:hypothetical protein